MITSNQHRPLTAMEFALIKVIEDEGRSVVTGTSAADAALNYTRHAGDGYSWDELRTEYQEQNDEPSPSEETLGQHWLDAYTHGCSILSTITADGVTILIFEG